MYSYESNNYISTHMFGLYIIIYLLFPCEYVLIEVVLNLLVGDIDAYLLERILGEILKAEDVQQADRKLLSTV